MIIPRRCRKQELEVDEGGDDNDLGSEGVRSDEEDDDFVTNDVKRRLNELRKNSFMVLIPEDSCLEDRGREGEEASPSSEWSGDGSDREWYQMYFERMLFFDKMISRHLLGGGTGCRSNSSSRYSSKKPTLPRWKFSFKKTDGFHDDMEPLHPEEPDEECHDSLETAYVAQCCLCWEALHSQYLQLSRKITFQPAYPTCNRYIAQAFQHFEVLVQRFIENEPFDGKSRVETYARARSSLSKFLQVPNIQDFDLTENYEDISDIYILATDLMKVMGDSIMAFHRFLKMDKNKSNRSLRLFGSQIPTSNTLQLIQASLEKKESKLKELRKGRGRKQKSWQETREGTELYFALIDVKIISLVLGMEKASKEQMLWCEEKMSKLEISGGKLCRNGSPLLFPC